MNDQVNFSIYYFKFFVFSELPGKNVRLKTEKQVSILDKAIASNPREYKLKLKRLELLGKSFQFCDVFFFLFK